MILLSLQANDNIDNNNKHQTTKLNHGLRNKGIPLFGIFMSWRDESSICIIYKHKNMLKPVLGLNS